MSEFGTLNLDEMQTEFTRLTKGGGQVNFLDQFVPMPTVKPGQVGVVVVRILPNKVGEKLFQYNRTHKLNGRSIHCPRPLEGKTFSKKVPCPICDYIASLWSQADRLKKSGSTDQAQKLIDEAREIKPVERYYYNAIVRSLVDSTGATLTNVGPRILSVGVGLHEFFMRSIFGDENDPEAKIGNFTDISNGYDLIIRKELTAGDGYPKYERSSFKKESSPAGTPEEIRTWVQNMHDLTKLRNPKDKDYLEKELAIHRGLIPDDTTEKFDTKSFDAKWTKNKTEEINEIMAHKSGGVVVPENVASEVAAAASSSVVSEDIPIEDEDFLSTLENMKS